MEYSATTDCVMDLEIKSSNTVEHLRRYPQWTTSTNVFPFSPTARVRIADPRGRGHPHYLQSLQLCTCFERYSSATNQVILYGVVCIISVALLYI